jgi:hypothetical protein
MPVMLAAMTPAPITAPCTNTSLREVVMTFFPPNAFKNMAPPPEATQECTTKSRVSQIETLNSRYRNFEFALMVLRPGNPRDLADAAIAHPM